MNAYLFKTDQLVKIVILSEQDEKGFFDIKAVPFCNLIESKKITFVEEFQNITTPNDPILTSIQPDILLYENINIITNYGGHVCVNLQYKQNYTMSEAYSILQLIDQIKSIQSQLSLN